MQLNNLSLAYLLEEIAPLAVGGFVNKIQQVQAGVFKIKIHTKSGSKDLLVTNSALFFTRYGFDARQNPHSFFAKLKKLLSNKKIISISQHEFDRVVQIEFSDYFLVLEFFHKSNIVLTDKNLEIVWLYKNEETAGRELKKGAKYGFPKTAGQNPKSVSGEKLFEEFQKSNETALSALVAGVNIAPLVAKEVLFLQAISEKAAANGVSKKDADALAAKIRDFYTVNGAAKNPVVFPDEPLPFEFKSIKGQAKVNSLSGALDEYYFKELGEKPAEKLAGQKQSKLNRLRFSLEQQGKAQKKLEEQAQENQKKGDLIYGHYSILQEIVNAVSSAHKKQINKKEIMYKINLALEKKSGQKLKITDIDLSKKEVIMDI